MEEARKVTREQAAKPVLKYDTHTTSHAKTAHTQLNGYTSKHTNGQPPLAGFSSIALATASQSPSKRKPHPTTAQNHTLTAQPQHHSHHNHTHGIPLFNQNDVKAATQNQATQHASASEATVTWSPHISASRVERNHTGTIESYGQHLANQHNHGDTQYQPLAGMTALFSNATLTEDLNYNPYASPLSAKDLGVEEPGPTQPSLVPRNMPLRASISNKAASPLFRSSSSGSLSSNATYSSNNSNASNYSAANGNVMQTNSFMKPRSESKPVQHHGENESPESGKPLLNNKRSPSTPNAPKNEGLQGNSNKRQMTASRQLMRSNSLTRYTTVPDLAPKTAQLNAKAATTAAVQTADNAESSNHNMLASESTSPAKAKPADYLKNNTSIVNGMNDVYVRPTVIKHPRNQRETSPITNDLPSQQNTNTTTAVAKVSSLSSFSKSSLKPEGSHIKYVTLLSNGHVASGTKTSPTVRNSTSTTSRSPVKMPWQSGGAETTHSSNKSSIPMPGSAVGVTPVSATSSSSTPSSAGSGQYLVRTFSTRARNMNYTPTKPYHEVSDGSTTSNSRSASPSASVAPKDNESTASTTVDGKLAVPPQSRPSSSRPTSGTRFYHKQSKSEGIMPRTVAGRPVPPDPKSSLTAGVMKMSPRSAAVKAVKAGLASSGKSSPRTLSAAVQRAKISVARAKSAKHRIAAQRVGIVPSVRRQPAAARDRHEEEWEDEADAEKRHNAHRSQPQHQYSTDDDSYGDSDDDVDDDEDFSDDEAIDNIEDDIDVDSVDDGLSCSSAAQNAGPTRIRSATRRMLGISSPDSKAGAIGTASVGGAKVQSRPTTARSKTGGRISTLSCISSDSDLQPALLTSIFPNIPPTINFVLDGEKVEQLPWEIRRFFKWRMSPITPNVVKNTINRSHFRPSKRNNDWIGYWGKHMKAVGFKTIKDYQKVNHFPGSFQIGRKDRLWRNLSRMNVHFGKKEFSFFPQTFVLPSDFKQLKRVWDEGGNKQKWIIKPPASARGIGIKVIHKWTQVPKRRPVIVQRYLGRPCLINDSKFDLRIYVYVTSYDPLRIYLYDDGLVRFASCKYSYAMKNLNNRYMHLTNYSINKKNSDYQANTDESVCQGHKWGLKALWDYLRKRNVNTNQIWENIKDLVIKTVISSEACVASQVKANCTRRQVCHELFGFDVMLDEDYKPWIIEVNISPSLHSNSQLDINIKGGMIKDLLNLAGYQVPYQSSEANTGSVDLPAGICMDKRLFPTQLSSDERAKHAYYSQRANDEQLGTILDVLTPDDVRMLTETIDEDSRRGNMLRIFPTTNTSKYLRFLEAPRYYNLLLDYWIRRYHRMESRGLSLLENLCHKKVHLQHNTDLSQHQWTPPNSFSRPDSRPVHSSSYIHAKLASSSAVLPRLHKKVPPPNSSTCSLSSLDQAASSAVSTPSAASGS